MVRLINKIPAGIFLVPMIISALFFTIAPDLFMIGGPTQALFSAEGTSFIIGLLCFSSGTGIDIRQLGKLFKRHGVLLVVKAMIATALSLVFVNLFGAAGILGVSALAFIVSMTSINPAVYLSLVNEYGDNVDAGAYALTGLFSIPALPMIIYGMIGSGAVDWMSILSTLIPLFAGIVIGNVDRDFSKIFGPGIGVLLPILGWQIGQTINLVDALQSGIFGVLITIVYYLFMLLLFVVDTKVLKNDGIVSLSMTAVAGLSVSAPAIVTAMNPDVAPYMSAATSQILTAVVITTFITPVLVRRQYKKVYGEKALQQTQEML